MFGKEQKQDQQQNVDIGFEKHGVVTEIHCPFYTDERTQYLQDHRDYGEKAIEVLNKELYFKSQLVKVIVYEGKARPICHLFDTASKKCLKKVEENTQCHII